MFQLWLNCLALNIYNFDMHDFTIFFTICWYDIHIQRIIQAFDIIFDYPRYLFVTRFRFQGNYIILYKCLKWMCWCSYYSWALFMNWRFLIFQDFPFTLTYCIVSIRCPWLFWKRYIVLKWLNFGCIGQH